MRKVITFLGTRPKDSTYEWQGKSYPGKVFAVALREFVEFDEMLVFITPEAKKETWPVMEKLNDPRIKPVEIKEGATSEDMWAIFQTVIACVNTKETVIFDITHGYRSLPFLTFLFTAYLKSAKQVNIEAIYYGALEMAAKNNGKAPVVNLSEFSAMLDWLAATEQFVQTGNADYLASQLDKSGLGPNSPLVQTVHSIAIGLELLRPSDVSVASRKLPEDLQSDEANLPKPFRVVSQRLQDAYCQFGLDESAANEIQNQLANQLRMINWYHQTRHYVHTLALAREWVVSLLCMELNLDIWDEHDREEAEYVMNPKGKNKPKNFDPNHQVLWKGHPHRKRINLLWSGEPFYLAKFRNDVLHTGYRRNPKPPKEIITQTDGIVKEINEIATLWKSKI